jgi:hypothetical protein
MYPGVPDFPVIAGEENGIEFLKDGERYRIVRVDEDTLIIHMLGRTPDQFELVLCRFTSDGTMFDVVGVGHLGAVAGYGSDRGLLARLF